MKHKDDSGEPEVRLALPLPTSWQEFVREAERYYQSLPQPSLCSPNDKGLQAYFRHNYTNYEEVLDEFYPIVRDEETEEGEDDIPPD